MFDNSWIDWILCCHVNTFTSPRALVLRVYIRNGSHALLATLYSDNLRGNLLMLLQHTSFISAI